MSEDNAPEPFVFEMPTGTRRFNSSDELRKWINDEIAAYTWVEQAVAQDSEIRNIYAQLTNPLHEYRKSLDQYDSFQGSERADAIRIELQRRIGDHSKADRLIESTSADFKFAEHLKDSHDGVVGSYALGHLARLAFNTTKPSAVEAITLTILYRRGDDRTLDAQKSAFGKLQASLIATYDAATANLHQHTEVLIGQIQGMETATEKHEEQFNAVISNEALLLKDIIETTEQELVNITTTYDQKLALQSSVSYWTNKKKGHTTAVIGFAAATGVTAILSALLVWFLIDHYLAIPISEAKLSGFAIPVIFSTMGVWMTRLLSKIFISNLHLRTDAEERVTMINTYLAILRDGQGLEDDQKRLILTTLFRPSATGYIADDGPQSLNDLIKTTNSTAKSIGR